ncbi:DUF4125 family protein [Paradesulfitobacterium ferrireducens]|uniref:DUF4125 family protein n=1 Tax=Paradesulfitobacterium ferrireducens TaxID=2816476 RepID=UPI001A9097C7|nr:DUF4125 family protein [Paradesulfitobacterium ferrireducens]
MKGKRRLINEILEIEQQMLALVSSQERAVVHDKPETFKVVRECSFELWSVQALQSYLLDLKNAQSKGINLLTLKYARMDDLVPPMNADPLIDNIIQIESSWEAEAKKRYPNIFRDASCFDEEDRERSLRYLRAEFETFSNQTLSYYYINQLEALRENRNLVEEALTSIFQRIGYLNLEEVNLFFDPDRNLFVPEQGY